jgi:hypothetical protein
LNFTIRHFAAPFSSASALIKPKLKFFKMQIKSRPSTFKRKTRGDVGEILTFVASSFVRIGGLRLTYVSIFMLLKKGNKVHLKLRFPWANIPCKIQLKLSYAFKEAEGVACIAFCIIIAFFVVPAAVEFAVHKIGELVVETRFFG